MSLLLDEFKPGIQIMSTAGAVPIKNDKGEVSMQKVKVNRYVAGKRPEYAIDSSDEEDLEANIAAKKAKDIKTELPEIKTEAERDDRRLRRLQERAKEEVESDEDVEERIARRRRLHEPELLEASESEAEEEAEVDELDLATRQDLAEESEEEEMDEDELENRRAMLRARARQQQQQEDELMAVEEEREEPEAAEMSEYEEYTDSEEEEEEAEPRLKPVFVRKRDRITIQEKQREVERLKDLEREAKKAHEDRRRDTLKIVADEARKDREAMRGGTLDDLMDEVNTDDDNDEEEYEGWKVRELKRVKRERDQREQAAKEKAELDRLHNLTEDERRAELKANPKVVTNKATKGKYKFLQKYYHRGAFFVHDQEEDVYQRDFSAATLEDHFDKTILPKVMQVKNFGRSGRTKYTHLVDQDTTHFDSPWVTESAQNLKFFHNKGGGMKQVFTRPSSSKQAQ